MVFRFFSLSRNSGLSRNRKRRKSLIFVVLRKEIQVWGFHVGDVLKERIRVGGVRVLGRLRFTDNFIRGFFKSEGLHTTKKLLFLIFII